MNSEWTPTYNQQSQTHRVQLQNNQQPQLNLITQGKNKYKILQAPQTGMNDPNIPALQPMPDVYNGFNTIPQGQNLAEFQKPQVLNRINTQEIKRHKQLFNQETLKQMATLSYNER